jgi:hypothetical protein
MCIRAPLTAAALCLLLATAGCAPMGGEEDPSNSARELGYGPGVDAPLTSCRGNFDASGRLCLFSSGIRDRQRLVLTDNEEWASTWQRAWSWLSPRPELAAIDFRQETVILVSMGERTSGGYRIEIREVTERGGDLEVTVAELSPGARCVVTEALTQPLAAARVPRVQGEVRFIEVQETVNCG